MDYRYKANGKDFFQITSGSLEKLLTGEALIQYLADKQNNNLDEKVTFFRNFSRIFNNLEGRIWWNGYIVCVDGSVSSRIRVKTVMFDPPAFIFDLSGLQHISATRNDTRLSFIGNNGQAGEGEGEGTGEMQPTVNRSFVIRGRTEHDIKQLNITHAEGTTLVSITLPTLSGIPVSTKNSGAKVATGTKSDGSMIGQLEAQTA